MKILVVGCGSIGRKHAQNAAKLASTAVVDTNAEAAQECAESLGVSGFGNLEEALAWKPDGVVIATPNDSHLPVATKAVKAGAHVLIEKPLSHTAEGVKEFLLTAEARRRQVYVVCNMRFHPAVAALMHRLKDIGRPLYARAHSGNYLPAMRPGSDYRTFYCASGKKGGGTILDGIHEIDYLMWLLGDVETVVCDAGKLSNLDIDVEDFAVISLTHISGSRSVIELDYLRRFKRRGCEIVGTKGMILWQSEGKKPQKCKVGVYKSGTSKWETVINDSDFDTSLLYMKLMEMFIDAVEGKDVPDLLTGRRAADVLAVALAAKKAYSLRTPVNPKEIFGRSVGFSEADTRSEDKDLDCANGRTTP